MISGTIKLDEKSPNRLDYLKGQNAIVTSLELSGYGTLLVCLLAFYKEGETMGAHRELYFYTPEYKQAKKLPPRKSEFNIGDYDFCKFEILTGSIKPQDEILLCYELDSNKKLASINIHDVDYPNQPCNFKLSRFL